jgi:serine/threonine protein kinase/WD40 repeat protein
VKPAESDPPKIPDHLLIRVIGRGSYGEVWLARNVMGTPRAVKIVRLDAFETPAPYEREFAGIRRYEPVSRTSPGLVQVLHVGRDDAAGFFYYVMELGDSATPASDTTSKEFFEDYQARTLRSDMKRLGRLPVADCVEAGLAIAEGLMRLHGAGLVHRDIKPSNIIFVEGRARLADIGLVGEAREGSTLVGTTGYIPPEGPGQPRGDLFALGKVLYEAASGQELARWPDTPPEWLAPGHEAEWEFHEIVLRLGADDPARRHADAATLRNELSLLRGGQSVRRLRMLERRMKVVRMVAAAAAVAAVLIAGVLIMLESQARQTRENLRRSENDRFAILLSQAKALRLSETPDKRGAALDALKKAAAIEGKSSDPELRDEAVAALMIPELKTARSWTPEGAIKGWGGIFDERVEQLAMGRQDGGIEVLDVANNVRKALLPRPGAPGPLTYLDPFSADGRWLLARDASNVMHVVPVAGGLPVMNITLDPVWLARDFTRDGRWLAVGQSDRTARLLPIGHNAPERRIPLGLVADGFMTSPDGLRLAAHDTESNQVAVVNLGTDSVELRISLPEGETARHVAWNRDSSMMATASDFQTYLWRLDIPERPIKTLGRHDRVMYGLAFSPDGTYLLTTAKDRQARLWNWATGTALAEHRGFGNGILWSPDGRRIGWKAPNAWEVLEFTPPTGWKIFSEPPPEVPGDSNIGPLAADFSPDGRWIATASYDAVRVYRAAGGLAVAEWKANRAQAVVFADDGSVLRTITADRCVSLKFDPKVLSLAPVAQHPLPHPGVAMLAPDGRCWLVSSNRASWCDPAGRWVSRARESSAAFCAASPDFSLLATTDLNDLIVLMAPTREATAPPDLSKPANAEDLGTPGDIRFAPNRAQVFRAFGRGLTAWNALSGEVLWTKTYDPTGTFGNMAVSNDGRTLAATFGSREILLISAADGSVQMRLRPPDLQRVTSLVFDSTGNRLAATCAPHVMYLWNFTELREGLAALGVRQ